MTYGIRVWSQSGALLLDVGDDTARLGGLTQVAAGSGVLAFQVAAGKTPFFIPVLPGGGGVSWGYDSGSFSFWVPTPCWVYYGEH